MKRPTALFLLNVFIMCCSVSLAQSQAPTSRDRWVSTWATAQQLMPAPFPGGRGGAPPQGGRGPQGERSPQMQAGPSPSAPSASQGVTPYQQQRSVPASIEDQTVRMIAHTSIGGRALRIEISNMANAQPLEIGSAHIALHKGNGTIVPGTDRILKFSGNESFVVPPGALFLSDPVDLNLAPFSDLAISLYLPKNTGSPTNHTMGLHTAYISKGNVTGSEDMPEPTKTYSYLWLTGIDVLAPADSYAIVALGDSITDGFTTTVDANTAWPALLAKRLAANNRNVAVLNQGISGNQVVRDGAGVSALARFDRDVLGRPGVKWIILLEGINDINIRARSTGPEALTSDELIAGYRQIIERAHMNGIKVVGATIMPEEGVPTASERGEEIRQTVNRWIRAKGNFDAVVDFDLVVQDGSHPARINPAFDPGDHIHPNDAGNRAMADAFDLTIFAK
jgi:lysophospholipase L1-like esterase